MLDDGFANDSEEYLAAVKYFSASSQPTELYVGCWDSETISQAVQACRDKNAEWCTVVVCGATDAELKTLAGNIEAMNPDTFLIADFDDADCLSSATNIFSEMKALNYSKTLGIYSPNKDKGAAIMGYAMGANSGLANSAYTLKFKRLVGVTVDDLTNTQVQTYIEANNGNVYINRGGSYDMLEQGKMCDGSFWDEQINLAKLANDIQLNVMDAFYQTPKIAQTEDDIRILYNAIASANEQARKIKFIHEGIWTKPNILNLKTGDTLPNGYVIQSESIDSQSQANRENRICPPIYNCIKLAGAIHSSVIQINVNR